MKKSSDPIVFFGSGPVAAKSLEFLNNAFRVEAVITKPAPSHHHQEAPVAKLAQEKSLKTYLVRDKIELDSLISLKNSDLDTKLGVLVDFGIIVSRAVLDHFELGIINSHFSLLPEWRGADPITFSILSGQSETGVSLMVVVEAMDEGPLVAQQPYALTSNMTTPELTEDLIKLSNDMLGTYLPEYIEGRLLPIPQNINAPPTYSRKLTKEDSLINPEMKTASQLEREIRAFASWPKSRITINGDLQIIIEKAHIVDMSGKPGTFDIADRMLVLHCIDKSLVIDRLKPAGKRSMSGSEFLQGYKIR